MPSNRVCFCMGVNSDEIIDALKNKGCKTTEDIQEQLYAGTSCGSCLPRIDDIVDGNI